MGWCGIENISFPNNKKIFEQKLFEPKNFKITKKSCLRKVNVIICS